MEPALRAPRRRATPLGVLPVDPAARPRPAPPRHGQGLAGARAAVRVLRRVRRLRRDAVHQAGHPAVRRPHDRRQRHRLLVDLRRQPAHDPVDRRTPTAAARPGTTRCSRTTPSSASGMRLGARRAARAGPGAARATRARRRRRAGPALAGQPAGDRGRRSRAARQQIDRSAAPPGRPRGRRGPRRRPAGVARRQPGAPGRVAHRRRRLGLRHRLRRPRPRARRRAAT